MAGRAKKKASKATKLTAVTAKVRNKGGRPKGSKNKTKIIDTATTYNLWRKTAFGLQDAVLVAAYPHHEAAKEGLARNAELSGEKYFLEYVGIGRV